MNALRKNLFSVAAPLCLGLLLSFSLNSGSRAFNPYAYYSLVYFAVFCLGFNFIYALKAGNSDFTGLLIAGVVIKLLLAFTIVFIYSLLDRRGFLAFSAHFISHYVLFTIFEIRYLFQLIKSRTGHEKTPGL